MNPQKKRVLVILCLVLIALFGGYGGYRLYAKNQPEEETKEELYNVLSVDTEEVTEIGIITEEAAANLKKEGESWVLLENEETEIDTAVVEDYLEDAASITSELQIEEVTDMEQYGLLDPSILISLQWEENLYTIKIGDYNAMEHCYYLRINDENTVYTIDNYHYSNLNKTAEHFEKAEEEEKQETEENKESEESQEAEESEESGAGTAE